MRSRTGNCKWPSLFLPFHIIVPHTNFRTRYLDIMAPKGIIFPLTVELGNYENFPAFPVSIKGITVQGSCVGSRSLTRGMLDFAARHGVKPIVQTLSMTKEGIEEAIKVLQEGKMRYRGVLVA